LDGPSDHYAIAPGFFHHLFYVPGNAYIAVPDHRNADGIFYLLDRAPIRRAKKSLNFCPAMHGHRNDSKGFCRLGKIYGNDVPGIPAETDLQ
jgi:hypothetical protein